MKRWTRQVAWVGIALTVVALALGVTERLLEPLPGVARANVKRLRPGMTLAEVEGLFGQPGGPVACVLQPEPGVNVWLVWSAEAGDCLLGFDQQGRVLAIRSLLSSEPETTPPLSRLRSLFGW